MMGISLKDIGLSEEKLTELLIESLTDRIMDSNGGFLNEVKSAVFKGVEEQVNKSVNLTIRDIITRELDVEFEERDSWGKVKGKYTLRSRVLKEFEDQCKPSSGYNKTALQYAFDDELKRLFSAAKKDIDNKVNSKLTKDCIEYAENKLKERLGIKN